MPLLEYFRLMHHSIDMEKARQEFIKLQLENMRRLELIREGDYGDPEFEMTIISDTNALLLEHVAGMHKWHKRVELSNSIQKKLMRVVSSI
ncbi:MAG: hypothetical protein ILNGONEN_02000 [Syntrophorhabdaceae bacterium]|nr:hypothetical protein [Syntrophorhabdaceae bacterium]